MNDGFLGRWSKRKLELKAGKPVEAEPAAPSLSAPQPAGEPPVVPPPVQESGGAGGQPELAPLTLEDVKALTAESDFSRFAAPGVAPEVKNAALKKLFSDPHYNIMDGLDVYIDDYSQPDPVPSSMVRQLASVKFLGLFAQEEKEAEAQAAPAPLIANSPTAQTVAQSKSEPLAVPEPPHHADADLRLQQDHAAPGEDPGDGVK
jgi:hypothetical protein